MSGYVIYILLEKNGWTICKQWRPWSDAAFCGIWSGSVLFANNPFRGLQTTMGLEVKMPQIFWVSMKGFINLIPVFYIICHGCWTCSIHCYILIVLEVTPISLPKTMIQGVCMTMNHLPKSICCIHEPLKTIYHIHSKYSVWMIMGLNKTANKWCFTPLSTLFESHWDEGRMIMKVSVQWSDEAIQSWAEFLLLQ